MRKFKGTVSIDLALCVEFLEHFPGEADVEILLARVTDVYEMEFSN